jgi:hypothetical protein
MQNSVGFAVEEQLAFISIKIVVPEFVPSLFHNSRPYVASIAEKYRKPLYSIRSLGYPDWTEPVKLLISFTNSTCPNIQVHDDMQKNTINAKYFMFFYANISF